MRDGKSHRLALSANLFRSSFRRALSGWPYGGSCNKDLFSMDRILHARGAQLVVGAAVEEIFLRRIFSGTERGKLELGFLNGPNIKKTFKKPFKNHLKMIRPFKNHLKICFLNLKTI